MLYTQPLDIWAVVATFAIAGLAVLITWAFTTLGKPDPQADSPAPSAGDDAGPKTVTVEMNLADRDGLLAKAVPDVARGALWPPELDELYGEHKPPERD